MAKPNFKLSKRTVSARFWANPELSRLVKKSGIPNLKLTMIGLWAFADEAGIFEWQPEIAASLIYGLDSEEDRVSVEPAMNAMAEAGFLLKIEVGGKFYGVWPNWGEHNDFAHKGQTRYPDVYAVHYGIPPGKIVGRMSENTPRVTAPAVGVPPTTAESRPEVEDEVEVEALPSTQTTSSETFGGGQEEKSEPAERLAKLLFKLLDQPRDQIQNAGLWEKQVCALLKGGHAEEEIASVMDHAIKNDTFSAEYLTIAKAPMGSFVKTYDNLFKGWKALKKGAAAAANREAKLKPTSAAPGSRSHGNDSGMEF